MHGSHTLPTASASTTNVLKGCREAFKKTRLTHLSGPIWCIAFCCVTIPRCRSGGGADLSRSLGKDLAVQGAAKKRT